MNSIQCTIGQYGTIRDFLMSKKLWAFEKFAHVMKNIMPFGTLARNNSHRPNKLRPESDLKYAIAAKRQDESVEYQVKLKNMR